jgi:hypothetical protein
MIAGFSVAMVTRPISRRADARLPTRALVFLVNEHVSLVMFSPRLRRLIACTSLFGAALCFVPPTACASDGPSPAELRAARELFGQAEQDEDAGRWQDALDKLRMVAHVKETAGVRYHLALCEERLGALNTALEDYTSAQAQAGPENAKDVLRSVGPALTALGPRVPSLTIQLVPDPADATVTVDGAALDRSLWGQPVRMNPGEHQVEASAPGRTPIRTTVALHVGEATVVEVALAEVPVPGPAPALSAPVMPPRDSSRHPQTAAIATTATAVVLVGFGGVAFFVAGSALDGAVRDCNARVTVAPDACDGPKNRVRAWDWTAVSAWGAGAVTATLAAFLWIGPSRHSAPSGRLVVGPGSIGLAGTF